MGVALCVVAIDTKVIVLTHSAVPACFHMVFALIAGIDKAVLALCVQLHQHAQGGPFGTA